MLPKLILLPGLHGTGDLFKPLLAVIPLQVGTRVIEHPTDRICGYEALYQLLGQQLRDEQDMVLVGESFSGALALQFAAAHPSRVRAVVLCASFVAPPVPRVLCYLATPLALLGVPIPSVAVRVFLSGHGAPRGVVRELKRTVRLVEPRVLAHRVRSAAWIDAADVLKRCPVPILCLAGTRDRLIGRRSIKKIRIARPDVTIKMIDGPHLLLQTNPSEAWQEICAFLKLL
jgi:pimeloyl-ACP methyl ester carboxylesterase